MTYMIAERIVKNIIHLMSRPFDLFIEIQNWLVQSPPTSTQPTRFFFHVRLLRIGLEETPILKNNFLATKLCTPRYKNYVDHLSIIMRSSCDHHAIIIGRTSKKCVVHQTVIVRNRILVAACRWSGVTFCRFPWLPPALFDPPGPPRNWPNLPPRKVPEMCPKLPETARNCPKLARILIRDF